MAAAAAPLLLTPESEWTPAPETLAALKYGGDLQEAIRMNDRDAVRAIQMAYGMQVLESDAVVEQALNAVVRQPSGNAGPSGAGPGPSMLPPARQTTSDEERALIEAALAVSLGQQPTPVQGAAVGQPDPSTVGGGGGVPMGIPIDEPASTGLDPLAAWCAANRFTEIESKLRAIGATDLEDLRYVQEDELKKMGLQGPACRRFFEKANQVTNPPNPTPPRPDRSDSADLAAAIALSLGQVPTLTVPGAAGPSSAAGPSNAPPQGVPVPLPVTKSDSAIAREMMDAEMARELTHQQHEERASQAARFDCPVCMEQMPVDGSFAGACEHRVCGDCIYQHISSKIEAKETTEAQMRCVLCPAPLETAQILGVLGTYMRDDLVADFHKQRLDATTSSGPFVKCPQCETVHALSDDEAAGPGQRSTCRRCDTPFCSKCAASRYHYFHAGERDPPDCAGLMRQKQASWLEWRAQGQAAYVGRLAQVDAAYAQQLRAHETEVEGSRQAYAAFQADEEAKRGWVHCPHCNVAWAGSDACPEVTCGVLEQAMGQQRARVGCGRTFNLQRDGIPYRPATAPPLAPASARPERPAAVTHDNVTCDKCGTSPIQGVRIRCLHCPCYNLCLPCLASEGPNHDAEEEWPGRDEPHVFEVLHEPVPP